MPQPTGHFLSIITLMAYKKVSCYLKDKYFKATTTKLF